VSTTVPPHSADKQAECSLPRQRIDREQTEGATMALVQTCKCEECGLQKSFANHWVMIIEHNGTLTVLPAWDEKKIRRAHHFCGRAHASRFVERWIANPGMALIPDVAAEAESNRVTSFGRSNEDAHKQERAEEKKIEQMLMLDENGAETSSARILPTPAAHTVHPAGLQAVPIPPACVLPPSLARLPTSYAREMRMMS
jgi:hypothetical protein